jgi:hypothetical protein
MTKSKNLILAFAPGSRGFLLSKWLYNNQLVNLVYPPSDNFYITDSNNHALNPFYNDVLFCWNDDSKDTFFKIKKEIEKTNCDYTLVEQLLGTSKFLPNTHNDRHNLILSHQGSMHGLSALKTILNSLVIRITLTESEINECFIRKFGNLDFTEHTAKEYYSFKENCDFAINVSLSQVKNLELDFLIKELK